MTASPRGVLDWSDAPVSEAPSSPEVPWGLYEREHTPEAIADLVREAPGLRLDGSGGPDALRRAVAAAGGRLRSLLAYQPRGGFGDDDVAALEPAQGLEHLMLQGRVRLSSAAFTGLARLHGLRTLDLGSGLEGLTDDDLADLVAGAPGLRFLRVGSCPRLTDEGLASLVTLRELRWLALGSPAFTEEGLEALAALSRLEELQLNLDDGGVGPRALEAIAGLPGLTAVRLGRTGGPALAKARGLRFVRLAGADEAALASLGRLPALEIAEVWSGRPGAGGVVGLAGAPRLRELTLDACDPTDADLAALAGRATLETLSLRRARCTDDGVARLGSLPALRSFSLAECRGVTGAGLRALRGVRRLQAQNLWGLTPDGMAAIGELPQLEELAIALSPVTDAGLEALRTCRTLKQVTLSGTQVTLAGVRALEAALPGCHVYHDAR